MVKKVLCFLLLFGLINVQASSVGFAGEWTGHNRVNNILKENGLTSVSKTKIILNPRYHHLEPDLTFRTFRDFLNKVKYVILDKNVVLPVRYISKLYFDCPCREASHLSGLAMKNGQELYAYEILAYVLN